MQTLSWIVSISFCIVSSNAYAQQCTAVSGPTTRALVELYTSEGCSSCPPADRWFSSLKQHEHYAGKVVPIALHVDYWDYIGWQDHYARPEFAARQRNMAALGNARVVYTPQVAMNGRDYRAWTSDGRFKSDIDNINQRPAQADIRLSVESQSAERLRVNATITTTENSPWVYYLAVQENNLQSAVKAGENQGALLHHDYVIRQWLGPFKLEADGHTSALHEIRVSSAWKKKDLGLVAFVQNKATGEILQALDLQVCANDTLHPPAS